VLFEGGWPTFRLCGDQSVSDERSITDRCAEEGGGIRRGEPDLMARGVRLEGRGPVSQVGTCLNFIGLARNGFERDLTSVGPAVVEGKREGQIGREMRELVLR
jgi:hypothetical protein